MLRVILELNHVILLVRAAHQMRLCAASHSPYLLQRTQHARIILMALTILGKSDFFSARLRELFLNGNAHLRNWVFCLHPIYTHPSAHPAHNDMTMTWMVCRKKREPNFGPPPRRSINRKSLAAKLAPLFLAAFFLSRFLRCFFAALLDRLLLLFCGLLRRLFSGFFRAFLCRRLLRGLGSRLLFGVVGHHQDLLFYHFFAINQVGFLFQRRQLVLFIKIIFFESHFHPPVGIKRPDFLP